MEDLEERVEKIIRQLPVFREGDSIVVEIRSNYPHIGRHLTAQYCSASMSDYDFTHVEEIPDDIADNMTGFQLFFTENGRLTGDISVHPAHRHHGIVSIFLKAAEDIAKEFGLKELKVSPPEACLEHFGYKAEGGYTIKKLE